jgi:hypothetical protein
MKIKTSDLTGVALDWAVAKCEGVEHSMEVNRMGSLSFDAGLHPYIADLDKPGRYQIYNPSTNWCRGGPIIEREKICLEHAITEGNSRWAATAYLAEEYGPTPLIAAMRCYVATKLGDTISIPNELIEE